MKTHPQIDQSLDGAPSFPPVVCPACAQPACAPDVPRRAGAASTACARCDCPCAVKEGLVCVNLKSASFGEADPLEMRAVLDTARQAGWRQAVNTHFGEDRSFVLDLIDDRRRINFADLLDMNSASDVLDIGCGYGGVSAQISRNVRSVTAVDITLERIGLLDIIKDQEGLDNVQVVCNGSSLKLPFEDNSFDTIFMIGVLEYFPVSMPDHSPWDAHVESLQEVRRVLKPGGEFYLATKNRFGWPFLMGARDHNNLRFGPVFPLKVADILCRVLNKRPYRIVSHGFHGYRKLLKQSGFGDLRVSWPFPGYQKPETFVPTDDKRAQLNVLDANIKSPLKRGILKTLVRLGVIRFFVPHFAIIARKR